MGCSIQAMPYYAVSRSPTASAAAMAVGDLLTAKYGMAWMEDPTGYRKEVL